MLFRTPEQVKKNEQVITQVGFISIEQLKAKREQMESWSQLCLDNLGALLK
jgi:predicted NUDIX family phosphoesterase